MVAEDAPVLSLIHIYVLEGEQQIGESIVLKNLDRLKAAAILQDAVLRQQVIDAILSLIHISIWNSGSPVIGGSAVPWWM